ncbi:hypothetical protein M569_11028, partial [Genlisea aurea]
AVLDTDSLLENDLVTLDEAWKASNNSALMVMNAVSILSSGSAPQNGILLTLERHFPFFFNIFKNQHRENSDFEEETSLRTPLFSSVLNLPDVHYMHGENSSEAASGDAVAFSGDIRPSVEDINEEEDCCSRCFFSSRLHPNIAFFFTLRFTNASHTGMKETLESESYGSRFSEVNALNGCVKIFKQPVGVKISKNSSGSWKMKNEAFHGTGRNETRQPKFGPRTDYYNQNLVASSDRDIHATHFKKQGDLSLRASSMLESERDAFKKWSRAVEMKYRGGRYKGRIEGGLPEGKGCLYLEDGSAYDGMWRNGKRSGSGTFYFSNGDFFQGSWRDDVMHGKGWMYFSSGDRWFANFWKGKANGEGRLYSKVGDVSFGKFKEGWRHGYFLHISSVDGTRCEELWDEGVLVSRKQL